MSVELKIKAKSLAIEARYIRKEELKQRNYGRFMLRTQKPGSEAPYRTYEGLRAHRMELRSFSRSTGLARAFLKGTPYATVEKPVRPEKKLDMPGILSMVKRFGAPDTKMEDIEKWMAGK